MVNKEEERKNIKSSKVQAVEFLREVWFLRFLYVKRLLFHLRFVFLGFRGLITRGNSKVKLKAKLKDKRGGNKGRLRKDRFSSKWSKPQALFSKEERLSRRKEQGFRLLLKIREQRKLINGVVVYAPLFPKTFFSRCGLSFSGDTFFLSGGRGVLDLGDPVVSFDLNYLLRSSFFSQFEGVYGSNQAFTVLNYRIFSRFWGFGFLHLSNALKPSYFLAMRERRRQVFRKQVEGVNEAVLEGHSFYGTVYLAFDSRVRGKYSDSFWSRFFFYFKNGEQDESGWFEEVREVAKLKNASSKKDAFF